MTEFFCSERKPHIFFSYIHQIFTFWPGYEYADTLWIKISVELIVTVKHVILCNVFFPSLFWLASARGLHWLRVLGQRLHGNPSNYWPSGHRRVPPEILLHWGHHIFALVPWRGNDKRSCWSAQVQVTENISPAWDVLLSLFLSTAFKIDDFRFSLILKQ